MIYNLAIQHRPQSRHRLSRTSRAVISAGVACVDGASRFSRLCTSFRQAFVLASGTGNGRGSTGLGIPKLGREVVAKILKAPLEAPHFTLQMARAA